MTVMMGERRTKRERGGDKEGDTGRGERVGEREERETCGDHRADAD